MTDERQTPRPVWPDRLAGPMFYLSLLFLLLLAGFLHRFPKSEASPFELQVIAWGLASLWLLFAIEAIGRLLACPSDEHLRSALGRFLLICFLPPLRIGIRSQTRSNHIWLPRLGWVPVDRKLDQAVEQFFSVPMIVIAFLVLPLLAIDYHWSEVIREAPVLALLVDVAASVIWLAFAVELVVRMSVADDKRAYCMRHWVDVLIVVLPFVEALPAIRVLRMARALQLEYLGRFGRLYRLRGLATKGWRALLLLQVVQRLLCRDGDQRLDTLRTTLVAKQHEIADLQREIDELTLARLRRLSQTREGHASRAAGGAAALALHSSDRPSAAARPV